MIPCTYKRTSRLSNGFTVEFMIKDGRFDCVWSPFVPKGRKARQILPEYRRERDAFLVSLGLGPVMVLEK